MQEEWYKKLSSEDKELVIQLKQIQMKIGVQSPLEPMRDPIKEKQIERRIDELFPAGNFYFYKQFKGNSAVEIEKNKFEQQ